MWHISPDVDFVQPGIYEDLVGRAVLDDDR